MNVPKNLGLLYIEDLVLINAIVEDGGMLFYMREFCSKFYLGYNLWTIWPRA